MEDFDKDFYEALMANLSANTPSQALFASDTRTSYFAAGARCVTLRKLPIAGGRRSR